MKMDFTFPGGAQLHYEKEPMDKGRFEMICWLIGIFMVGSGFIKLISLAVQ